MDADRQPHHAGRAERRAMVRKAEPGPVRNLRHAAAFEDAQRPLDGADDSWLLAAGLATDARRADVLAGRGMSVVGWDTGDCHGCVRDLAARRARRDFAR